MTDKKTCFIIMPITTPASVCEKYRDGEDHFKHVLDCLFVPAIEKADYIPILPTAKGSDFIQAEIIRNLETADLVLCDISALNPNVFFEFGIRTALNKPVSIVRDEYTDRIPFDASVLNCHTYKSTLNPWEIADEINNIIKHIHESAERSNNVNTLWRYFGLKFEAKSYEGELGVDSRMEYILLQMDSLMKKVDSLQIGSTSNASQDESDLYDHIIKTLFLTIDPSVQIPRINNSNGIIEIFYTGSLSSGFQDKFIISTREKFGITVVFREMKPKKLSK